MNKNADIVRILHLLRGQRAELARGIDSGTVERRDAELVLKGLDHAIATVLHVCPEPMELEKHIVVNDIKISQISYCRDLSLIEVIMKDGTIRVHRGVDSGIWYQVRSEDDILSGYYSYVWNRLPAEEQRGGAQ